MKPPPVAYDERGRRLFDERIAEYIKAELGEQIGEASIVGADFRAYPEERFVIVTVKTQALEEATEKASRISAELEHFDPDFTILVIDERGEIHAPIPGLGN